MEIQTPFIRSHFDTETGTVSLETANGQLQIVAQYSTTGNRNFLYEACPVFIATYSETIDIGNVLKWTSKEDIDAWLNRLIYSSFLSRTEDNHEGYWFVKTITTTDPSKSADIPTPYKQILNGANKNVWILLIDGIKIWPVQTINNQFYTGWDNLCINKTLRPGYRIIFGAEKKWIFHIIVLDENLDKVHHHLPQTSDQFSYANIDSDYLSTSCAPSIITSSNYNFQFAHLCNEATSVNQVFGQQMEQFRIDNGNTSVEFIMGMESWLIPIVNDEFYYSLFTEFLEALELCNGDLILVGVVAQTKVRVLVLNVNGLETNMNGFKETKQYKTSALMSVIFPIRHK